MVSGDLGPGILEFLLERARESFKQGKTLMSFDTKGVHYLVALTQTMKHQILDVSGRVPVEERHLIREMLACGHLMASR